MNLPAQRPRFLDLRKIRLPLPGLVSIFHRVTGLLMVLAIPFGIYLLDLSLSSVEGYQTALGYANTLLFKFAATLILWSLTHHLFAGIRFLLLDLDVGVERHLARTSSIIVFALSLITTLLFLGTIW
jgi:succinate dehydrogenase / fumarate reductase cytochrome b subunit